ncbi:MAG: glycosyltransferase [Promethearchaeota archaeon]
MNIIIPAWKEGKEFRECLESITNLKYPRLKVIVNAGGDPETVSIAESFKDHKNFITLHQKRGKDKYVRGKGKILALNECLAHVSEGILYFIDADCYLTDELLSRMIYPIINDKEKVVVGAGIRPLKSQERIDLVDYIFVYRLGLINAKFERYSSRMISGANTCVNYEVMNSIGKFNEHRLIPEDISRGFDIISKGFKVYCLNDYRSRIFSDFPTTIKQYTILRRKYIQNKLIFSLLYKKRFFFFKYILLLLISIYLLISPIFIFFNIGLFYIAIVIFLSIYFSRIEKFIMFRILIPKELYKKFRKVLFFKIFYYIYIEIIVNVLTLFNLRALRKNVRIENINQNISKKE